MSLAVEPASFRDPSGFIFTVGGTVYRQVRSSYKADYDRLMESGLYAALVEAGLLIPHTEDSTSTAPAEDAYRVLRPEPVPFISYPYEWCFSQLKDASLATLRIQKQAVRFGMSLKDASAYNIQYVAGRPVLIDTLSFEEYRAGRPWVAYRQFCQHFLAPLALMSRKDVRLGGLLRNWLDGIPLDLASSLLPVRTRLNPGTLFHIHLHGAAQRRQVKPVRSGMTKGMSTAALLGLIDSLESVVRGLTWRPSGTEWSDYYDDTNYSGQAMEGKRALVDDMLAAIEPEPRTLWDLGANTGRFSRIAAGRGIRTVAWDVDPAAVEKNYLQCRADGESRLLPLLQDLANPSPDLGWALKERRSILSRGPADAVMALALVHHLAIGNNVPFEGVAEFLRAAGRWLIVEFVPKIDSQVQRLLVSREDIFPNYTEAAFEQAFVRHFRILKRAPVPDSHRTIYLMRARVEA